MTKIPYTEPPPWTKKTRKLVSQIVEIVEEYDAQGYKMTLRQLYYRLVVRKILQNIKDQYAKLSGLLTDARMAGIVDWDFIEDRIRVPEFPNQFTDIDDAQNTIVHAYRLDRWEGQEYYVEIIIEKDALSGVFIPIANEYHIHFLANHGYTSTTAMHDLALRLKEKAEEGKKCLILYFGDHDASGNDMVRDIEDRLGVFGCDAEVRKVALTMEQIREFNLPPDPAKLSDPRSGEYISNHGNRSWEVDALPPDVLVKLARNELDAIVDNEKMNPIKEQEEIDKEKMRRFGKRNREDE